MSARNKEPVSDGFIIFALCLIFFFLVATVFFMIRNIIEEEVCVKEGVVTEITSIGDESTFVVDGYNIKQSVDELVIKQPYCLITHKERMFRPDIIWHANETLKAEFPIE